MIKQFVTIASLIFLLNSSVFASFLADRPLSSDDTSTPGKNEMEIIFGFDKPNSITDKTTNYYSILAYGILDNLDIELSVPFTAKSEIRGLGDLSIGSQLRINNESQIIPSIAFALSAKLSTANKDSGLGSGSAAYMLEMIGAKSISDLTLIYNLNYNHTPSDILDNNLSTSIAAVYPFCKHILLLGECIYNLIPSQSMSETNILGGLVYSLDENTNIDFGIGKNLAQNTAVSRITAGISSKLTL